MEGRRRGLGRDVHPPQYEWRRATKGTRCHSVRRVWVVEQQDKAGDWEPIAAALSWSECDRYMASLTADVRKAARIKPYTPIREEEGGLWEDGKKPAQRQEGTL